MSHTLGLRPDLRDCGDCDLYQAAILDHGRHPRNRRAMDDRSHLAHNVNPACGDELAVFLKINDRGVIGDIAFDGQICAIATASASLMTEVLLGKTPAQAKILFDRFHALATGEAQSSLEEMEIELKQLTILSGVRDYPSRLQCATLAWHTMLAALADNR
jgi:nitrogen fixation NifU-like protein